MKRTCSALFFILTAAFLSATTLDQVEKICILCQTTSTQTEVRSTNTMGSPDLDLRPAEMMRSTMPYWVQRCPHCGYCARDIGEAAPNAELTVKTDAYRAQLEDSRYPELANSFLCLMLVNDGAGNAAAAHYYAVCAAWACDDSGTAEAAVLCRGLAVARLKAIRENGATYMKQAGGDEILFSDLLRRTGQFKEARRYAEKGLSLDIEPIIRQVLELELKLLDAKDAAAHKVEEATK